MAFTYQQFLELKEDEYINVIYLDFQNTNPYGVVSSETPIGLINKRLTELPESIGKCTELRELNCTYNHLSYLPKTIGNCRKLRVLKCSNNILRELPETIGELSQLRVLDCPYNCLTQLPPSLGDCKQLKELSCSKNELSYFPITITNMGLKLDVSLEYR